MRWICRGATDVGRVRVHNEDRYWIGARSGPAAVTACAVVDGMGGQSSGGIASESAVAAFERYPFDGGERALDELVRDAMMRAHDAIRGTARGGERLAWGATAVLFAHRGAEIAVAHVGDCRAYLLRDGAIEQRTIDHSLVEESARSGTATRDELEVLRTQFSNIITRSLGFSDSLQVDTCLFEARRGDVIVLCCDGVWRNVAPPSMLAIVEQSATLDAACAALLAEAHQGEDNNTVVIARLEGDPR